MKKLEIVCGVIKTNAGFLIARRGQGVHEGVWEFPGGKVETSESQKAAVIREIREELELDVRVIRKLLSVVDERSDIVLHVHAYLCELLQGTRKLHAHHEVKFVATEELLDYPFEQADEPILKMLQEMKL